jgi:hypothetical protein
MTSFTGFLMELYSDDKLLSEFKKTPSEVLDRTSLTQEQKKVLLSKNSQAISSELAKEHKNETALFGLTIVITLQL